MSDTGPLSREWVVGRFRDVENEALRRHKATAGTDGTGKFYVLCSCPRSAMQFDEWIGHVRAVAREAPRPKSNRAR